MLAGDLEVAGDEDVDDAVELERDESIEDR